MTKNDILKELKASGDPQTKKTLSRHGAKEPFFGVKVADLKKILKKTKKNHELSLELFDTGNSDAMYLAGLMADEKQITKTQLNQWVKAAYWSYLSEYTVPWVAAETPFGFELGLKWIESKKENVASSGWATLAYITSVTEDENLDIKTYKKLLKRVEKEIHNSQNRVRYAMNNFVISMGTNVKALTVEARKIADKIGAVNVEMGGSACKVPLATAYIDKAIDKGRIGKKRKTARC